MRTAAFGAGGERSATVMQPVVAIRLLGPPRVLVGNTEVGLAPRAVGVLVRLALADGWVDADRLLMDLWGEDVDPGRRRSLQTLVSALRRVLGNSFVQHRDGSYRVESATVSVDLSWFLRHAERAGQAAERADGALASICARAAMELWDGDPAVASLGQGLWLEELEAAVLDRRERMNELIAVYDHRQRPGIEYAVEAGRYVAFSTFGSGDPSILLLGGLATHLEGQWDEPGWASWASRLATFGPVVVFDKRGTGLSDSISSTPTVDDFVDDAIGVLDAVGAGDVIVVACGEAGLFAPQLAVTDERVRGVVFLNAVPKISRDATFEIGVPVPTSLDFFGGIQPRWGSDAVALDLAAPSMVDDLDFQRWAGRYQRLCTTPGNLRHLATFTIEADARADVDEMGQPALVLQSAHSRYFSPRNATWLADHLDDHRLVWLDSADHLYWLAQPDRALEEIGRFVSALSDR